MDAVQYMDTSHGSQKRYGRLNFHYKEKALVWTFEEDGWTEEGEICTMNRHILNKDSQAFAQQMNFKMAQLFKNGNINKRVNFGK